MKVLTQVSDKIYPITKAYALKGTLLPEATLESLSEAKDLGDLITRLKATAYSDAVSKITPPYAAYKVEVAAKEHVAKLHYNFMKVYPNVEILIAYFTKYVVGDLKTVLKGKAIGRSYEEIQHYLDMHAEELIGRRDLVARALAAANLDEAVNLLKGSDLSDEVENAVTAYNSTQKLDVFDVFLDRALYQSILAASTVGAMKRKSKKLRTFISIDIDSYNVLAVLRAKSWEVPPSQIRSLIVEPTSDVPRKTLESMVAAPNVAEAAKLLSGTPYTKLVQQASGTDAAIISNLEEGFKYMGYERAVYPFQWDVFSEAVVLSLIKLKELEVRNISAIAFGIEHGLGSKAIMQKLVLPK